MAAMPQGSSSAHYQIVICVDLECSVDRRRTAADIYDFLYHLTGVEVDNSEARGDGTPVLVPPEALDHDPRLTSTHSDRPEGQSGAEDFNEFYLSRFSFVRNVINRRAQDWMLAEEVTDEAMAIAYRKWDELREHPNPVGFVIVTAYRILLRIQRQRARKNPPVHPLSLEATPGLELKAPAAGPDDIAVNRTALEQALRCLAVGQRERFVLHEILGYPIRQVAELLNLPEGTVKTRLRAARRILRDLLNDNLGEEGNQ
jgi:RNA polymerase sigma-70 factor (ECF subfamily)